MLNLLRLSPVLTIISTFLAKFTKFCLTNSCCIRSFWVRKYYIISCLNNFYGWWKVNTDYMLVFYLLGHVFCFIGSIIFLRNECSISAKYYSAQHRWWVCTISKFLIQFFNQIHKLKMPYSLPPPKMRLINKMHINEFLVGFLFIFFFCTVLWIKDLDTYLNMVMTSVSSDFFSILR